MNSHYPKHGLHLLHNPVGQFRRKQGVGKRHLNGQNTRLTIVNNFYGPAQRDSGGLLVVHGPTLKQVEPFNKPVTKDIALQININLCSTRGCATHS